jgi:plastocyanin
MKKIAIVILVLIIIVGLVSIAAQKADKNNSGAGKTHTIVLEEEGYKPSEISIKKGDTVTFKTALDKPFWPASNIHPTHGIYSEFDPKEPIMPDRNWSFKFDKAGNWKFHDHLAPYYTGTITVSE